MRQRFRKDHLQNRPISGRKPDQVIEQRHSFDGDMGASIQVDSKYLGNHFLEEASGDQNSKGEPFTNNHWQKEFDAWQLAQWILKKTLGQTSYRHFGIHERKPPDIGPLRSTDIRPYEHADPYDMIDIQSSLLKAVERSPNKLGLKPVDLHVFQSIPESRFCFLILIDASGSMQRDGKIEAAVETAMFLYWLAKRPMDRIRMFFFSETMQEVHPSGMMKTEGLGDTTDISFALRACRRYLFQEKGDRQVYLMTDGAPNTESGKYVGFKVAKKGFLNEAIHLRQNRITLNTILLEKEPKLMELAREIAKNNLGRVFFSNPEDLTDIAIEDFFVLGKFSSLKNSP
jgi:Ca-activated chloride channel family protein